MKKPTRAAAVIALPVLALSLTGCTKTIDNKDLQKKLAQGFQQGSGVKPDVSCPSGQQAKKGKTFVCTIKASGQTVKLKITLTDDKGHFSYTVVK